MKKVTIFGTGAFGTALACQFAKNKVKVYQFGINNVEIENINNFIYSYQGNDRTFDLKIFATNNIKEAMENSEWLIIAVPSEFVKNLIKNTIIPNLTIPVNFVIASKGFDLEGKVTLSDLIDNMVDKNYINSIIKITGPTYAIDLVDNWPSRMIVASKNKETAYKLINLLGNDILKFNYSDNLKGVEYLSILKNTLAIYLGIIDGLGYPANTKSFVFVDLLNEIRSFGKNLDINDDILVSYAGIGDLFLTSTDFKSRNYSIGYEIGRKNKLSKRTIEMYKTVEGIRSSKIILELLQKFGYNEGVFKDIYNIIFLEKNPKKIVEYKINKKDNK